MVSNSISNLTCKAIFSIIVTLMLALDARAALNSGWERPVRKAAMAVTEARGIFSNVKEVQLVMTQQDGQAAPTGLMMLTDHQQVFFDILAQGADQCQSKAYLAGNGELTLRLVDHSARICMDFQPTVWQAMISNRAMDVMLFSGNPERLFTSQ